MRNQFSGKCYRCGLAVPVGAGYFELVRARDRQPGKPKWRTRHCDRTHNGGITCEMAKLEAEPKKITDQLALG